MLQYRYDSTFEGFLCAVAHCLAEGEEPELFLRGSEEPAYQLLFDEVTVDIPTDLQAALEFRQSFVEAASRQVFASARYAFHSQQTGVELLLWRYFKLGLRVGQRLVHMLADSDVNAVDRISRSVAHQAHKYLGFVRFREVEQGFLYARIEPQYDILCFIAPHFATRVGDRPWVIHDLSRSQAAVYDLKKWRLVRDVELSGTPDFTAAEQECALLWRRYFDRLAIEARRNLRLQRQHVPMHSRRHMVEFTDL